MLVGEGEAQERQVRPLSVAFPACCVRRAAQPGYVALHAPGPGPQDVVLVTLKNKCTTSSSYELKKEERKTEVLDLTGSPLKLDMSLNIMDDSIPLDETQHWLKEEATHLPMPVEHARNVANLYNEILREVDKDQAIPLWIVCNGADESRTLLLTVQSYRDCFNRGLVTYEGETDLSQVSFEDMSDEYIRLGGGNKNDVQYAIDCKYRVLGMSYATYKTPEEMLTTHHEGITHLQCEWSSQTMEVPLHTARISLEQEVIVGHERSPCHSLWTSICALNSINRCLVEMTAAGYTAINLNNVPIRASSSHTPEENMRRLNKLLSEVESYSYTAMNPPSVNDEATTLKQCLTDMEAEGASYDFTFMLWDIMRDCQTAEELVVLLLHALKVVSTGKMKPFIIPTNKTYLSKLVLKLSRGHSQTSKVLKNLRLNPTQALSLVGQVCVVKTTSQLTQLFTLLDHTFVVNNMLQVNSWTSETVDQINQTIHDMTMGADTSLNPFENKSLAETSIRLDSESFCVDTPKELTVDNFASLKKVGLVQSSKEANEVPLILDEIDISSWKAVLMKFAQLFVSLEHLNRAQQSLRTDISSLKPIAAKLQEYYASDKSPIKTVGQLLSEPVQKFTITVPCSLVQDHIKKRFEIRDDDYNTGKVHSLQSHVYIRSKLASYYRVRLSKKPSDKQERLSQIAGTTYVFSQQPVFPPSIWKPKDLDSDDTNLNAVALKYHVTKYVHLSTSVLTTFSL